MPDLLPPTSFPDDEPGRGRHVSYDAFLLAGGLVLFLVLLYEMHVGPTGARFLTPPLVAAAGVILLWPVRALRAARALFLAGGFLLALWMVDRISGILIPFFIVYAFAFLFDPLVQWALARFRVPRWVSSLVVTVVLIGLIALFFLLLVPRIISQVEILATRLVALIGHARDWLLTSQALDMAAENFRIDKRQLIDQLSVTLEGQAAEFASRIPRTAQRIVGYIGSLVGLIMTLTLFPVVLYYTLKDYPFIKRRLVELFPTFGGRRDYLVKAGGIVGNYLRGQLTISLIAAINVSVALLIFDAPFALLIGIAAGILNLVPNLGVILTNILGVLLAVIFGDPWLGSAITVFFVLLGESILEQSVLVPRILGNEVGLHPVVIILSLLIFGSFLGLFGLLIAVPATALIMTVYKAYRHELHFDIKSPVVRSPAGTFFRRRSRAETPTAGAAPENLDPS